jgi:hypothetical protein
MRQFSSIPAVNRSSANGGAYAPPGLKDGQIMALRSKLSSKESEDPAQELFSQRRKSDVGQFRLQVDRQTKASFATYEAAEAAGMAIKSQHPVVRVAVYDAVESVNRIIELPKS